MEQGLLFPKCVLRYIVNLVYFSSRDRCSPTLWQDEGYKCLIIREEGSFGAARAAQLTFSKQLLSPEGKSHAEPLDELSILARRISSYIQPVLCPRKNPHWAYFANVLFYCPAVALLSVSLPPPWRCNIDY